MLAEIDRRQRGFTLVELMVAMVVGMVVLAAVTNVMVSSNSTNLSTLRMIRFNQELRSVMDLITSDLRRAGGNGLAVARVGTGTTSPLAAVTVNDATPVAGTPLAGSCIRYGYEDDSSNVATWADDALNGNEQYGFRLNASALQRSTDTTGCGAGTWQALTDPNNLTVTALTFTVFDHVVCGSPLNGMHIQTVQIVLTASSPNVPGLTRTLTETVRMRNDRYQYYGPAPGTCAAA